MKPGTPIRLSHNQRFVLWIVLVSLGWLSYMWQPGLACLFFAPAWFVFTPRKEQQRVVTGRDSLVMASIVTALIALGVALKFLVPASAGQIVDRFCSHPATIIMLWLLTLWLGYHVWRKRIRDSVEANQDQPLVVRRTLIAAAGITLALLVSFWLYWSPQASVTGHLSFRDLVTIRWVVRTETFETILKIFEQSDGRVLVQTGRQRSPLDGGGHCFILERKNGWKINEQGFWMSRLLNPSSQIQPVTAGYDSQSLFV